MIYTATITAASLRLRESRIIADLLLQRVSPDDWNKAVIDQNILQMGSPSSMRIVSRLLKARLEPLGEGLWEMVRDGGRELALQATFAGALKNSRLLSDFMDIAYREQRAIFAKCLDSRVWLDFIAGCRGRDPEMPHWTDATLSKLRSAIFSILAEVGYLQDTKSLIMQNVFLDTQLASYLSDRGETYLLRCLEVTE
jgi:hypothetical protein